MKKKGLLMGKCCLCIFFMLQATCLSAQNSEKLSFEEYVARQNKKFDNYQERCNKEFADFLRKSWEQYETLVSPPKIKKPVTPPVKPLNEKPIIPVPEKVIPKVVVKPMPIKPCPTSPIKEIVPPDNKPAVAPKPEVKPDLTTPLKPDLSTPQVSFVFFGNKISVPDVAGVKINLKGVDENAVADAWQLVSAADYMPVVNSCLAQKGRLQLNDWGYLQLLQQFTQALYNNGKNDEQLFLTNFILNQSGYCSQLGRSNDHLILLVNIEDMIYSVPRLKMGNKTYVVITAKGASSRGPIYTYSKSLTGSDAQLSMLVTQAPLLAENNEQMKLSNSWHEKRPTIPVNKNLIDFYNTMPQMDAIFYLRSASTPTLKEVEKFLSPFIAGKTDEQAVGLILDFVQKGFAYKTDGEQFGREKFFFPDETIYYPFSDCEDRSILFTRLVTSMLGLKVALLNYPNHIAAAVQFKGEVSGTYFMVNRSKYVLCDPTYVGAVIGECMPQFRGVSPEITLY